jgi:hypothetical protein
MVLEGNSKITKLDNGRNKKNGLIVEIYVLFSYDCNKFNNHAQKKRRV